MTLTNGEISMANIQSNITIKLQQNPKVKRFLDLNNSRKVRELLALMDSSEVKEWFELSKDQIVLKFLDSVTKLNSGDNK